MVKEPNAYGLQLMASLNKADTIKQALNLGGKDFDASFVNSMRILFLHLPPLPFSVRWNNEYPPSQAKVHHQLWLCFFLFTHMEMEEEPSIFCVLGPHPFRLEIPFETLLGVSPMCCLKRLS